ncbi:MAG: alpha/beta hydrolase [Arenicellales bacterium]
MNTVTSIQHSASESVLLLHCSASSSKQWEGLRQVLAGRRRAYAADLYGYGESASWSGPGPLSLAAEAAHAASALPADAGAVHVVGHSYGGAVALRFAAEHASRVRSLTLIEPVAFHLLRQGNDGDRRLLSSIYKVSWAVIGGVLNGDYQGAMGHFVDYWNGAGAWDGMEAQARRRFARHAPKVVLDFHAAMNEDLSLDACRQRFTFPVCVIRGESSPEPARRIAELLSESIPGAGLVTVPGAGHMLPLTHPDRVNAAVREHIEGGAFRGSLAA